MKITAKDLPHHDQPSDNDGLSHEPFIEFPYTRAIAGMVKANKSLRSTDSLANRFNRNIEWNPFTFSVEGLDA